MKSEKLEGMESKSIIGEKSQAFAKRIAKCNRFLTEKKHEGIMSKQLLRCGTMRTSWWCCGDGKWLERTKKSVMAN